MTAKDPIEELTQQYGAISSELKITQTIISTWKLRRVLEQLQKVGDNLELNINVSKGGTLTVYVQRTGLIEPCGYRLQYFGHTNYNNKESLETIIQWIVDKVKEYV